MPRKLTVVFHPRNNKTKDLKYFFDRIATGKYDFIVIDTHPTGKLRIRKNLIEPIDYVV